MRIRSIGALALLVLVGCGEAPPPDGETETGADDVVVREEAAVDYAEQLQALYEKAKAAGEGVPQDALEWAKSDVKKIGTWDYDILSVSADANEDAVIAELKERGSERWECFWVEPTLDGKRFYLKKRRRSYVQLAGKASAFVPVPSGGE